MNGDITDARGEIVEVGPLNVLSPEVVFVLPPISGGGQVQYGAVLVDQDFPGAVAYAPLESYLRAYNFGCAVMGLLAKAVVGLEGVAQQLESTVQRDRVETLQRQVARLRIQKRRLMALRHLPNVADGSASEVAGERE